MLFDLALNQEEEYWKQKVSINWCASVERNTKLFHSMAQKKKIKMRIQKISHLGEEVTEPERIRQTGIDYFTNHLQMLNLSWIPQL